MIKVELTLSAQKDLRLIYQYSKLHFGQIQAFEYVSGLRKTIGLLKTNPYLGRRDDAVSDQLFRLVYRQTIIYYRIERERLIVRRILDGRQDPLRHL